LIKNKSLSSRTNQIANISFNSKFNLLKRSIHSSKHYFQNNPTNNNQGQQSQQILIESNEKPVKNKENNDVIFDVTMVIQKKNFLII
jgi:hypothetical protein